MLDCDWSSDVCSSDLAHQAGDELEQLVSRGSPGAALSAEQAARFSRHLGARGDEAVRAARLHTG
jgi:hypothetical protein